MSCSAAAHCRRSKVITAPVWSQSIQAAAVRAVHRWVAGTVGLGLPDYSPDYLALMVPCCAKGTTAEKISVVARTRTGMTLQA